MFTELTINGETYQLRLTTRTSVQLEKALGFNPLDILIAMEDGKMPKLSDCLIILQYMLLSMNHGFNADKTMELYDSYIAEGHTMLELIPIFMDVFKDSGYFNEDATATEEDAKN